MILAAVVGMAGRLYSPTPDPQWRPQFPAGAHTFSAVGVAAVKHDFPWSPPDTSVVFVTQRGNVSENPVWAINASDGTRLASWGKHDVAVAPGTSGPLSGTWGAHGLSVEQCFYPCGEPSGAFAWFKVWIEDFTGHTMKSFTGHGKLIDTYGTAGVAGNGTAPLQFGNVADATVVSGSPAPSAPPLPSTVYASDGDGGSANRVVAFESPGRTVLWATPAIYANPHSIALHARSELLVVADREHEELRLLRSHDGHDLGPWTACNTGLHLGPMGRPFGVRTYADGSARGKARDLLFIASMDNPQDGKYQRISVIDTTGLSAAANVDSPCTLLQTIHIDPQAYSGPHLLGIDGQSGDIYAALVADKPHSTVLRFKCEEC